MDFQTFLFWVLALLTGGSAIMVVVTQNIVRAAAWLLFALGGTAGIYFLIGADFVGATQLIVYVGGILILVVFGVMLTAQGPFINLKASAAEWAVALTVGLVLFGVLVVTTTRESWYAQHTEQLGRGDLPPTAPEAMQDAATSPSSSQIGLSFLGLKEATPEAKLSVAPHATNRSQMAYLLPFEIVSVHLLVVLIGAAYLARAKRRRGTVA
jgi:NADH-quinone oxidoreductase subunit J